MNSTTLESITAELAGELNDRRFGRVFQPGRGEFAFDLRLPDSRYLYIDLRPGSPAIFLIRRRLRDLERSSGNPSPFALTLKKRLSGGEVASVRKIPRERVIEIEMSTEDELGTVGRYGLVVQLTGRSANLFLTDGRKIVLDRARDTQGEGQQIGDVYSPPTRDGAVPREERVTASDEAVAVAPGRPSEVLDRLYSERAAEQEFTTLARAAGAKVAADIRKREKLIANLQNDLTEHGSSDEWKRLGDLLLSNASTATREGSSHIRVTDYYDDELPEIEIEIDENDSITEAAEKYYRRYTKARNAAVEVSARLDKLNAELEFLRRRAAEIDRAVIERDTAFLEGAAGRPKTASVKETKKLPDTGGVARRFVSSDGFEILVGKRAKDNDVLTFKIARSLDTWMHAADYPGSHVVVRNPNRTEIPQRTLLEAARLAAFYSQGKSQVKAAVHYTQKKFVNKPKGAAPGLVSLASFKTLLVEPGVPEALENRD